MSTITSPTHLADPTIDGETPDAFLLQEFVSEQDEAAFAALVRRHGGLVRGVCRRILLDPAAADDAFQQTFLSLSQHAPALLESVAPTASLGSWLYRVAVNAALQLKRKARSRRRTETQFAEHRPAAEAPAEPWNEVLPALDEEISALPGQYRSAVVKCHLEGKTQQDAAKELGITYATLRRRLKEARGMLRNRLSKRGFTYNSFMLLPLLGQLAPDSVSAQTAAAVTNHVVHSTAATASATAATAGASVGLGTKLLALNPLIKAALAGVFLMGAGGGWWLVQSQSFEEISQTTQESEASGLAENGGTEASASQTSRAKQMAEPVRETHFAYVLENGKVATPEFENATKALTDLEAKRKPEPQADLLRLPQLASSKELLESVNLGSPMPKDAPLVSQPNAKGWTEDVSKPNLDDPNNILLAAEKATKPVPESKPDPLTVEQVMEFLNEKQHQHAKTPFVPTTSISTQFFGHPAPAPATTIKVVPLP